HTRASQTGFLPHVLWRTMAKSIQALVLAACALLSPINAESAGTNAPEAPRASVTIPELKTTGRTIHVAAGGSLQKALDDARGGDRIELEPRATYEGPFHLKPKDGEGWIVIAPSGA